jgi:hypothetical protein
MSTDVSTFLAGDRAPAAKFPKIKTSVGGPITEEPRVVQQTDFTTRQPLTWSDGSPRMQLVVIVQTDRPDDENDDGRRRIFVKGQMKDAVNHALRVAGVKDIAVGGTLTVTYIHDGERTDGGFGAAPKIYEATYVPPDDSAADGEAIGGTELGDTDDDDAPPF